MLVIVLGVSEEMSCLRSSPRDLANPLVPVRGEQWRQSKTGLGRTDCDSLTPPQQFLLRFVLFETVSMDSPSYPGTHVNQASLELRDPTACLCLLPTGTKGVPHSRLSLKDWLGLWTIIEKVNSGKLGAWHPVFLVRTVVWLIIFSALVLKGFWRSSHCQAFVWFSSSSWHSPHLRGDLRCQAPWCLEVAVVLHCALFVGQFCLS